MAAVKFDHSVKYNGVRHAAHEVFTVEDADVEALREELLGYKLEELITFAEEHDIDLQGKTRKADVYNIIVASFE